MPRTSTRDLVPILRATQVDLTPPLPKIEDHVRLSYKVLDLERHSALIAHPHGTAQGFLAALPIVPPFPVPSVRLQAGPRGARVTLIHSQSADQILVTISPIDFGSFGPPVASVVQSWGGTLASTFQEGTVDTTDAIIRMFTVEGLQTFTEGKDAPLPVYPGEFIYLHVFISFGMFFTLLWDEPV